jgi:predicted ATP-grasp superfamily ATP-dependent carboligase
MPLAVKPTAHETVLLLGNYRPTLTVARTMSLHGYRVAVGLGGGEGCTEFSRFVAEAWDHPPLVGSGEAFLSALQDLLASRPDITIVYPVAEEFVRCLAEAARVLPRRVVIASPRPDVIRTCCNKLDMLRLVQGINIDHLPFRSADSIEEMHRAAHEIGFPLVVRPLNNLIRFGHKKALIARSRNELARLLPQWPDRQGNILLQRQAQGERQDVFFAAAAGRIVRAMQVRYLQTDHVEGTGLCVHGEIQPVAERLLDQCCALARALNYTGVGCAQFIVDTTTGQVCFVELNPRISAIHRVTEESGMQLTLLAIALARGGSLPAHFDTFHYRPGRRFAWTYGALRAIKSAIRYREIGIGSAIRWLFQSAGVAVSVDFHLTWRWDDPLPTIMLFLRQFGLARSRDSNVAGSVAPILRHPNPDAVQGGLR